MRTASQLRENSQGTPWYAACSLYVVMERALLLFPVLSAAAGYLLDGVTSAASGPFILAWLLGTR
jgi:hypothetical protein